ALEAGLTGEVRNTSEGVTIIAHGSPEALAAFARRLCSEAPPLSIIEAIESAQHEGAPPPTFSIAKTDDPGGNAAVTADAALCTDCAAELFDPSDRRHRYAFINCTNCGPRFSIVTAVPYDRPATTMRPFAMCADCRAEYEDPTNRRFHAEPIACLVCGPKLRLVGGTGEPIEGAQRVLRAGGIVGVMGLGGFHLAVRAEDARAVARLRARKRRPSKPFALMVRDLTVAARYGDIGDGASLTGVDAPIVLMPALRQLSGIAPGLAEVGLMLPSTPLHALLMAPFDEASVMTSANRSGEPPVTTLEAAQRQLGEVADVWLVHDRAIANRVDDSLVRRGKILRRARGHAPQPIPLPEGFAPHPPVLAMGGDKKNAFAIAAHGRVVLSQHMGDLQSRTVAAEVSRTIDLLARLSDFVPAHVAADAHPGYRSRAMGEALAQSAGIPCHLVGHHHAHIASCLCENGRPMTAPPVLALTLDGLGMDEPGRLLGCELWRAEYRRAVHLGGLAPTALLGGDKAAREPWRNLLARLQDAFGDTGWPAPFAERLASRPCGPLLSARGAGLNAPLASYAGRLFDAVAAALGLCEDGQDYEGEAPMRLEAIAVRNASAYRFALRADGTLDPSPIWSAIAADLAAGVPGSAISGAFHNGLADGLVAMVAAAKTPADEIVALSGGTFHNDVLNDRVKSGCEALGLKVLEHRRVPAGDGGLALGQAAVAIARLCAGDEPCA
ncbi:MAG: carbamoyltransferase HypF, partial [Pseudomonadota bacterium]